MTICLTASTMLSKINLKGPISIPDSPKTIFDLKLFLKPFTHSPFFRNILSLNYRVVISPFHHTFYGKNGRIIDLPYNFNEFAFVSSVGDFQFNITCIKERVKFLLHSWGRLMSWVDGKARFFLKFESRG